MNHAKLLVGHIVLTEEGVDSGWPRKEPELGQRYSFHVQGTDLIFYAMKRFVGRVQRCSILFRDKESCRFLAVIHSIVRGYDDTNFFIKLERRNVYDTIEELDGSSNSC